MLEIRDEQAADVPLVHDLHARVFPTEAEAKLVDALRDRADPVISLVAADEHEVVGHVLFSPVELIGSRFLRILGLGPMAVMRERQNRGIGTALVREGLQRCRALGAGAVVVLGHPGYYPRFGFEPASRKGIHCEFDAPDEAFMVIELTVDYFSGRKGTIRYHEAFAEAS